MEAQVFRIVQEALTNVRKHSGARRADIAFAVHGSELEILVTDDGHGLEAPSPVGERPRYGLRAMRERADSIGAAVDWSTPTGGGCRVRLIVATGVAQAATVPAGAGAV